MNPCHAASGEATAGAEMENFVLRGMRAKRTGENFIFQGEAFTLAGARG